MPKHHDDSTVAYALDALFERGAWPADAPPAHEIAQAIAHDPALRARFDALAMADRALTVKPDDAEEALSDFERQFSEDSFLGALDLQLEQELKDQQEDQPQQPAASPHGARRALILLAATVTVASGAMIIAAREQQSTRRVVINTTDDLQARSAYTPQPQPHATPIKSRHMVYCLEGNNPQLKITGAEDVPFGALTCPQDAKLKLAYINPHDDIKYMAAFGADTSGRLLWYGPSPAAPETLIIEKTDEPRPVAESIELKVNHTPGLVRVYAVFSAEPLDYDMLKELVAASSPQALTGGHLVFPPELHLTSTTFEVVEAKTP